MALTTMRITAAAAAAVLTAGAAIAGCAQAAPRPVATSVAKRGVAATPAGLSASQGTKICDDLNAWLAGARHQSKPRFSILLETDQDEANYSALGTDLLELDSNLLNLNSGALQDSPADYYPVTGLRALSHDCAGYGVSITEP